MAPDSPSRHARRAPGPGARVWALVALLAQLGSLGRLAAQAPAATLAEHMEAYRYECVGPLLPLATPQPLTIAGRPWLSEGWRLTVQERDADDQARLGVLSAIKDMAPETRGNLHAFLDWFAQERADAIIVNGDLALDEDDLEALLALLGQQPLPVFVLIGNSESSGSFQRATRKAFAAAPNVINLGWVRHVVGDDFELVSVPGYHDKRFVRGGSACLYKPEQLDALVFRLQGLTASAPRVLVSHGPPAASGAARIDVTFDGDHVGDPALSALVRRLALRHGIHGHILEAGGTAATAALDKAAASGANHPGLFINAGSANSLPWRLNDGRVLCGQAALYQLHGARGAAVRFLQRPCPTGGA